MTSEYGILAISDISLGYGSPQIQMFLQSMAAHYDTRAYVIEADEPHRPPVAIKNCDRLKVERIVSAQAYWTLTSHAERNLAAAEFANAHRPSVIVMFSPMQLPIIDRLDYKPAMVIMYMLEIDADTYLRALRLHWKKIDRFIFPEYERMRHVLRALQSRDVPVSSMIYNVVTRDPATKIVPADKRDKPILYAGTLSTKHTFADEFVQVPLNRFPIHIYGNFSGDDAGHLRKAFLSPEQTVEKGVEYKGYISSSKLRALMPQYAYSLVRWNPAAGLNYHYACPNKFFEAIAYGVPPISAPHPQCVEIINRFDCGILAGGYGKEDMAKAIQYGLSIFGTPEYERLVANCLKAYETALNGDAQFARFASGLPAAKDMGFGA